MFFAVVMLCYSHSTRHSFFSLLLLLLLLMLMKQMENVSTYFKKELPLSFSFHLILDRKSRLNFMENQLINRLYSFSN